MTPYSGINVTREQFVDFYTPILAAAMIFHTKGKDKNLNSILHIQILDFDGAVLAEKSGVAGHWRGQTSYLIPLDIVNLITEVPDSGGRILIEQTSSGDNSWQFDCELFLFSQVGVVVQCKWENRSLSGKSSFVVEQWFPNHPESE